MKSVISIAIAILLAYSNSACSSIYYTEFNGSIVSIEDTAGIAEDNGLFAGSPVRYLMEFDFEQVGYKTYNSGEIDYYDQLFFEDPVYAKLLFGSLINEKDDGFFNAPTDIAAYNNVYISNVYFANVNVNFELGSDNNKIELHCIVYLFTAQFPPCTGFEQAFDSEGLSSLVEIAGDISFSETRPIPLPSIFYLFIALLLSLNHCVTKRAVN